MNYVRVTNRGKFQLADRYDGQAYVFKVNEPLVLSHEAARHIFGYGLEDKAPALARQGWLRNANVDDDWGLRAALDKLARFQFQEVEATYVEAKEPHADSHRVHHGNAAAAS